MLSQSLSTYSHYTLKNMEIMSFLQLISSLQSERPYFDPPANEERCTERHQGSPRREL